MGMAALTVLLTVPEGAALLEALGQYADAIVDDPADGPPRTRQQKMVDCLLDLVLRPGESDLPVVRAQVTVVAPVATLLGGDQPGRGRRRPGARGDGPRPRPGSGPAARPGRSTDADDDLTADVAMADADEAWWAEVEARARTMLAPRRGTHRREQNCSGCGQQTAAELAADPELALLFGSPSPA